jgi:hypothetical protein
VGPAVEHLAVTFTTLNFVEGEGISVQTGPSPGDPDVLDVEIASTIGGLLDAKGDLVAGTGLDTYARLPVGADGEVLTADSTAGSGLAWAADAGGGGGSLTDTHAWMPLVDSDGTCVLDTDGNLIPTLIAL